MSDEQKNQCPEIQANGQYCYGHPARKLGRKKIVRLITESIVAAAFSILVSGAAFGSIASFYTSHGYAVFMVFSAFVGIMSGGCGLYALIEQRRLEGILVSREKHTASIRAKREKALEERTKRIEKAVDQYLRYSRIFNKSTTQLNRIQAMRESGFSMLEDNGEITDAVKQIERHGRDVLPGLEFFTTDPARFFRALGNESKEISDLASYGSFLIRNWDETATPVKPESELSESIKAKVAEMLKGTGWKLAPEINLYHAKSR